MVKFDSIVQDLINRKQYDLAYKLQKESMNAEFVNRQKESELINKITDEVIDRIKIKIMSDTTIIDELFDKIHKLGR